MERVDILEIKKHMGVAAAAEIFSETIHAAKILHDKRDPKFENEPFLYLDGDDVRFPRRPLGLMLDSDMRPDLKINLEKYFEYGKGWAKDISSLPQLVCLKLYA